MCGVCFYSKTEEWCFGGSGDARLRARSHAVWVYFGEGFVLGSFGILALLCSG